MYLKEMERKIMLLNFRVKNFKSFVEDAELNMLASPIKEHSASLIDANGIKVLPIAAFFGANGCGKTNYIDAYATMHDLVLGYGKTEKQSNLKNMIYPFIFNKKNMDLPSEFEISIYDSKTKKEYRYGFTITKQKILEEWLFMKTFSKTQNLIEKCIFYREINEPIQSDILDKEKKEIEFVNSLTLQDELLITNIGKRENSKYSFIYKWFYDYNSYIDYSNDLNELCYSNKMQGVLNLLYHDKNELKLTGSLLNVIDESIQSIKIKKEMDKRMNEIYTPYSIHKDDDGKLLELPFTSESSGTRKMLMLAVYLLDALYNGYTIFIDELDSKLHPLILRHILKLFTDKETNKGGGQLIFTSHNLICLDSNDLRRDEIWFVEKVKQRSTLFSLYDFKETSVRNDLSFGKHYLNGRFGAVPFIRNEE